MKQAQRLERIARSMTPTELVLLEIEEARLHPDMVAHARAIAAAPPGDDHTLCGRIEASVRRSIRHVDDGELNRAIRSAQFDGLFLGSLARIANTSVFEDYRERSLAIALMSAMGTVFALDESIACPIEDLLAFGQQHLAGWEGRLGAVGLVEREHFRKKSILYPGAERRLRDDIEAMRGVLHRVVDMGGKNRPLEDGARAPGIAEGWTRLARAQALAAFDARRQAVELVRVLI